MLKVFSIRISILTQENFHQPVFPTGENSATYKEYWGRYDYLYRNDFHILIFNIH